MLAAVAVLSIFFLTAAAVARGEVFLWPQPQSIQWSRGPPIFLSRNFSISTPPHPDLRASASHYNRLVTTELWRPVQAPVHNLRPAAQDSKAGALLLELLVITVLDTSTDLQHGVNESYNLRIPEGGGAASLRAPTVWGAIRGLETFSQLVRADGDGDEGQDEQVGMGPMIEHAVEIEDWPLYSHRGLMLDTSRNFFPVESILRTIRAMGHNKLNVFHWHVTDSHSFPLLLPSEPELAGRGSYGRRFQYSPQDVKAIVKFARAFAVRVVPEIDMPGHTASFGGAYPEIVTCAGQAWIDFAAEPTPGQLDPLNPKTFEVVGNVIHDMTETFQDHLFHVGADEVNIDCWMNSSSIQQYVTEGNRLDDALTSFINATKRMLTERNKITVYWEDVLTGSTVPDVSILDPSTTILQTWQSSANTQFTTSAGFRTIVSASDFFYLDCGHGQWLGYDPTFDQSAGGDWCSPFKTWQHIYDCDITADLTDDEAQLVIGAEAVLWSEQADEIVLDAKLWPRSAALAESLWSSNRAQPESMSSSQLRSEEAINRLNDWRFRLVARGIAAEPLQPFWCLKHPNRCNY